MKRLLQSSIQSASLRTFSCASLLMNEGVEEVESEYMEGNLAAAEIAHKLTNLALLYPITPSSPMAEYYEALSTKKIRNIFNTIPLTAQMQSEAGAGAACHGSLVSGGLATSFTSSQGLALWYPVLWLIAYQLHPFVLHVAARSMAGNATSILGDHNDVMGVRASGFAMLASRNPQECYDKAVISHVATLKARVPFLHFFDGQQVSHQMNYVEKLSDAVLTELYPWDEIYEHMDRGLSYRTPERTGSSCGHYTYQLNESVNPYFAKVSEIVEDTMEKFFEVSGREYKIMEYHGSETAENVVVCMGTTSQDVVSMVNFLNEERNYNVGCVTIHLYRPFDAEKFRSLLPHSVKKIAVLDRCKEANAQAEPLCMDVMAALQMSKQEEHKLVEVIGGRYGLAQGATEPNDILAVFEHLDEYEPFKPFTLGIVDDMTGYSLLPSNASDYMDEVMKTTSHAVFYGKGSDGTVSSVNASVSIFGTLPGFYSQSSNRHTPHKAGAITISELRWSQEGIINCGYPIVNDSCDFVFCNNPSYLSKFNMVQKLKPSGGTFVINTVYDPENDNIEDIIPNVVLKRMTQKENVRFIIVDAEKVLKDGDMPPGKINFVMLTAFLQTTGLFERERILELVEEEIRQSLEGKGGVIEKNIEAIKHTFRRIHEIPVKEEWKELPTEKDHKYELIKDDEEDPDWIRTAKQFVRDIQNPFIEQIESSVPVSKFKPNGFTPLNTAQFEKRSIATQVPIWVPENCIQCNQCAFQCPHSVIRPYVFDNEDIEDEREFPFPTLEFKGDGAKEGDRFMIAISPNDCTGCLLCTTVCPVKALDSTAFTKSTRDELEELYDLCQENNKNKVMHFQKEMSLKTIPLQNYFFEFNGACAGCAEAAVIKIIAQLFGKRMTIANATGCTTVFSSYYITSPYTQNRFGCGPAYGRSLFENAAEYGLGMYLNTQKKREVLLETIVTLRDEYGTFSGRLAELIELLFDVIPKTKKEIDNEHDILPRAERVYFDDGDFTYDVYFGVNESVLNKTNFGSLLFKKDELEKGIEYYLHKDIFSNEEKMSCLDNMEEHILLKRLKAFSHLMVKPSHWIVGGDGWAYDIGFGGLDHVLSTGLPINIMILDNENYANTGGQASKASPLGTTHKLCTKGKEVNKKDITSQAMTYGNVYVGQVSLLADPNHFIKTVQEAEEYKEGPALLVSYCPCEQHYIKGGLGLARKESEELAVKSGMFPLFTYNPFFKDEDKRLNLRTKKATAKVEEFISREKRFKKLFDKDPERAEKLLAGLQDHTDWKLMKLQKKAGLGPDGKPLPPPNNEKEVEVEEEEVKTDQ